MARNFGPVVPPNDPNVCPPWLNRILRHLGSSTVEISQSISAVARGEVPDGSGSPLLDLSQYFFKPGLVANQTAYGGTQAAGTLTLSSTFSGTKGYIYLGSAQTSMFDETNQRLGLNTTPRSRFHSAHTTFETMATWEGPYSVSVASCICNGTTTVTHGSHGLTALRVGMLVSGTGVPTGTTITATAGDASMTVSNTITSGTKTLTFADKLDLNYDSTDNDHQLKSSSAIALYGSSRASIGNGQVVGLRLTSQKGAASGASSPDRIWLEAENATAANQNMAIAGNNGGNGNSLQTLFSYVSLNTWNGTNLTNVARVGINADPADYASSTAANQPDALIISRVAAAAGVPAIQVEGASSATEFAYAVAGASGGTAPSKTRGAVIAGWRFDGKIQLGGATAATSVKIAGTNNSAGTLVVTNKSDRTLMDLRSGITGFADSVTSAAALISNTTDDGFRFILAGDAGNILARFGVSATATVIAARTTGAIPAPVASCILTLDNGTKALGIDISAIATANKTWTVQNSSGTVALLEATQAWTGTQTFKDSAFIVVDDVDNTKKLAFQCSGISTSSTVTLTIPNHTGTLAVLNFAQTWTAKQTFLASSFAIKDDSLANQISFDTSLMSASRTYSMPNASGTIALTSVLLDGVNNTDTLAGAVVLGDLIHGNATPKWARLAGNITTTKQFLSQVGSGAASAVPVWSTVAATDISGGDLTKTDDTNVTLTLGGTPTGSLLKATSLTLGWTGQLSVARGGTGLSAAPALLSSFFSDTLAGSVVRGDLIIGNSTPAWSRLAKGTAKQLLSMDDTATDITWRDAGALGIPRVVATYTNATLTASTGLTSWLTTAPVGFYRATAYIFITTAGLDGDIASLTFQSKHNGTYRGVAATSGKTAGAYFDGTTTAVTEMTLASGNQTFSFEEVLYHDNAASDIKYTLPITLSGGGTPSLYVEMRLEYLGA